MADDNPFADPANINPFADPSVQAATGSAPQPEEYNPFADEPKQSDPEPVRLPPPPSKSAVKAKDKEKKKEKAKAKPPKKVSEPAIMEPDEPPEYTPAPSSFRDAEDDQIRKKEEEIARREAALQERERNIERLGSGETPKNFPPFPKFCPSPFKPCFYISVKNEIPPSEQWKVYLLLALMIYLWTLLILNLIVSIAGVVTINTDHALRVRSPEYLTTMGVAIAYLILFAPGSLFCWFLPAYHAYRRDSSLAFMWFFFTMAFQILSFLLGAIGPPNLGACGWYNGSVLFATTEGQPSSGQIAIGIIYILLGFLWLFGIIPSVILIIMIHRFYRTSGGSINRAVAEGVKGAAKNEAVRGAVKSTVKAGVKSAMTDDK